MSAPAADPKPCCACGKPRPAGRVNGYCRRCARAIAHARHRQPGLRCASGQPVGAISSQCLDCRHRRWERWVRTRRPCPGCGGMIERGYRNCYCRLCTSWRQWARRHPEAAARIRAAALEING